MREQKKEEVIEWTKEMLTSTYPDFEMYFVCVDIYVHKI